MKILVTDCFERKTFDIYNVLLRHYSSDQIILTSPSLAYLKVRLVYHKTVFRLRKFSTEVFCNDLLMISQHYENESMLYLPIEEDTTELFLNYIQVNGARNFLFSLPEIETFHLAQNKYVLNKFCLEHYVPAPILFESSALDSIQNNFIPLIVKPRIGTGSKGLIHINLPSELEKLNAISQEELNKYVIQEKVSNGKDVIGAFFLCKNGESIVAYCHERIRTYPLSGGVTVYSKISFNQDIIAIGKSLMMKLNWTGVAMLEFLYDFNTKTYKVIEINPRFWGSILLSEYAGTHFICNYINLCLGQSLTNDTINTNAKIRWFPIDLLNFIKLKGKISNFWKFDIKNTCYINMTYANFFSTVWFHLFFYLNVHHFKNFKQK